MRAMGAAERVFELLDRRPALPITGGERLSAADLKGRIAFDRVSFRYPSRPNVRVLRSLSLRLEPGRVLALVGPSGGGKTTIASLILRFYDPTAGTVSLDGRPLTKLDPRWLRDRIGFVSQEPVLFAMSIKDNIAFGLNDPPMDKIKQAAMAYASDARTRAKELLYRNMQPNSCLLMLVLSPVLLCVMMVCAVLKRTISLSLCL
jgi:ABC-type multidrug transport system fused ATPase/permease subunit